MAQFRYQIQFPTHLDDTRNSREVDNDGDAQEAEKQQQDPIWHAEQLSRPHGEEKEIVVILFGWSGCKDQYLAKYSDIYLKRGCIVLRYIAPPKLILTGTEMGSMTQQLVAVLQEFGLDTNPVFFHVFSNGGTAAYSSFLQELQIADADLDIRGTVFDSAPAPAKMSRTFRATVNVFGDNAFRHVLAAGIILCLGLVVLWFHIKTVARYFFHGDDLTTVGAGGAIWPEVGPTENWMARITQVFKDSNFLFIYSEVDELIAPDDVDLFADIMEKRGNRVRRLKFSDSAHVKHYAKYPKEYVDSVVGFMQDAMAKTQGKRRPNLIN